MSFIRPPAARPVRAPSRPPSPPRTQQQRQPSPQSRSPQRPQQPAQVSGKGWRHQTSNQPDRPQQQATGGGWRNAGNQQGSQQARPIRGGWPVQVNPLTGERLGLRGGGGLTEYQRKINVAQSKVDDLERKLKNTQYEQLGVNDKSKRKEITTRILSLSGQLRGAKRALERAISDKQNAAERLSREQAQQQANAGPRKSWLN